MVSYNKVDTVLCVDAKQAQIGKLRYIGNNGEESRRHASAYETLVASQW